LLEDPAPRRDLPLLLTLGLGVFAGALDLGVLAPALPALAQNFGIATGDLAWVFTLYLLVTIASIAIAGTMADRYGRREASPRPSPGRRPSRSGRCRRCSPSAAVFPPDRSRPS